MILGIVAVVQSKKAGAKNGLGVAAIIVGAVLTLFWIIGMILFVTAMSAIGGSVLDAAEACANGAESVEVAGQLISCADVLSQ
ncbi:hypothetical protein [Leucobacter soli]|uniref:DUF4190 domain-containing protein n=3 Tax=Leucobacter soli TaxID=2812850 RepID=A0A916K248_9MICO|nr:hypothetical protein LEUCIP111803_01932 [Leucobacter soli]